mmetsp:Transcript_4753/g.15797  ORF Transcript_4753/g.15797 Transcript_4753/m.15797 type:complete len:361 (+) Transcript_4753:713-1795(+)
MRLYTGRIHFSMSALQSAWLAVVSWRCLERRFTYLPTPLCLRRSLNTSSDSKERRARSTAPRTVSLGSAPEGRGASHLARDWSTPLSRRNSCRYTRRQVVSISLTIATLLTAGFPLRCASTSLTAASSILVRKPTTSSMTSLCARSWRLRFLRRSRTASKSLLEPSSTACGASWESSSSSSSSPCGAPSPSSPSGTPSSPSSSSSSSPPPAGSKSPSPSPAGGASSGVAAARLPLARLRASLPSLPSSPRLRDRFFPLALPSPPSAIFLRRRPLPPPFTRRFLAPGVKSSSPSSPSSPPPSGSSSSSSSSSRCVSAMSGRSPPNASSPPSSAPAPASPAPSSCAPAPPSPTASGSSEGSS